MSGRAVVSVFGLLLVAVSTATKPGAAGVVDIQVSGVYFSEPATVRFIVAVEPDDANRTLSIEADGESMYTASEIALQGASDKRLHQITFKSLVAGRYWVRAQVRSSTGVRGVATREIVVVEMGRDKPL